ncbi:hypothetical protein C8Q69DRAFT_461861 [Paecilomyces variotii]|uniref:Uncharacterized protein n=1 Tax=Byssochlamys spectabilis TaxID=264951 RepID=A0A443HYZ6_BYSSP|nr:hypothetical protein C8Q69DRAFT_461861 [Paecilomyces variotii]RWQ96961.1 hypothetical protein C8Q69DRAFT_461861 [Paecilomyces variotii]
MVETGDYDVYILGLGVVYMSFYISIYEHYSTPRRDLAFCIDLFFFLISNLFFQVIRLERLPHT